MHVIRHEAIGQHVRSATAAGFGEQLAVLRIVLVREERLLAAIAPLRHMVGQPRRNHSGKSCHADLEASTLTG
jgi:hypothetical protein